MCFFPSFFSPLAVTWNVLCSCMTAGDCKAPHFPGDWPLLPLSLDNIGGHCTTHVHLSLKDEEATLSTQTHSIGVNMRVWIYKVLSPCVFVEGVEFARPCVYMCLAVCVFWVRDHVCVCPHSVSQLSLQSVYIWLQGKSSSKKWILTQWAPHINSFSHIRHKRQHICIALALGLLSHSDDDLGMLRSLYEHQSWAKEKQ